MLNSERETSIAYTDADEYVRIYSCIRKDITAMKKKEQFKLHQEGVYEDGTPWATFHVPRDKFDVARAAKTTRSMTEDQRKAASDRMAAIQKERYSNG